MLLRIIPSRQENSSGAFHLSINAFHGGSHKDPSVLTSHTPRHAIIPACPEYAQPFSSSAAASEQQPRPAVSSHWAGMRACSARLRPSPAAPPGFPSCPPQARRWAVPQGLL